MDGRHAQVEVGQVAIAATIGGSAQAIPCVGRSSRRNDVLDQHCEEKVSALVHAHPFAQTLCGRAQRAEADEGAGEGGDGKGETGEQGGNGFASVVAVLTRARS